MPKLLTINGKPAHLYKEERIPPRGIWGVFCEPIGHAGNPRWTNPKPVSYDEAQKEADYRNCSNYKWYYYAKPILDHKSSINK